MLLSSGCRTEQNFRASLVRVATRYGGSVLGRAMAGTRDAIDVTRSGAPRRQANVMDLADDDGKRKRYQVPEIQRL
jgi:hypothetical protein